MTRASAIQKVTRSFSALFAAVTLCQCALPPGSAWTVIRKDGFKEYLAVSWGKKPVPEYVKELLPEAFGRTPVTEGSTDEVAASDETPQVVTGGAGDEFPPLPSEMPENWNQGVEPAFPLMSSEPPEFPSLTPPVVASETTPNPPLVPDPPAADEFAKVSIPEFLILPDQFGKPPTVGTTQKAAPGLKMKDPAANPSASLAQGLSVPKTPEIKTGAETKTDPEVKAGDEGKAMPEKKVEVPKQVAETKPKDASIDKVVMEEKKKNDANKVVPKVPLPADVEAVPFGKAVPGRPGYVRSPFAKDHQLVDVTDIKGGDSVKCPFSGKFFRVPVAQEVKNRVPAAGKESEDPVGKKEIPPTEKSKEPTVKPE